MTGLLLAMLVAVPRPYDVTLQDCHDADTCTFSFHLGMNVVIQNQSVRFCSINAPEVTGAQKDQGTASLNALMVWLRAAQKLVVAVPQKNRCPVPGLCDEHDKYGRLLGTVFADGVNINQRLVDTGLAEKYYLTCE